VGRSTSSAVLRTEFVQVRIRRGSVGNAESGITHLRFRNGKKGKGQSDLVVSEGEGSKVDLIAVK
jgi:hypothetical protein